MLNNKIKIFLTSFLLVTICGLLVFGITVSNNNINSTNNNIEVMENQTNGSKSDTQVNSLIINCADKNNVNVKNEYYNDIYKKSYNVSEDPNVAFIEAFKKATVDLSSNSSSSSNNKKLNTSTNVEDVFFKLINKTLYISNEKKDSLYNGFDSSSQVPWFNNRFNINKVIIDVDEGTTVNPKCTKAWFGNVDKEESGKQSRMHITSFENLDKIDMSAVADASFMFSGCLEVEEDTEHPNSVKLINVSNITNVFGMLNFTNFSNDTLNYYADNLSKVNNTAFAFANCPNLNTFSFKNIKISQITNLSCMFLRSASLTEVRDVDEKAQLTASTCACMFYDTSIEHAPILTLNSNVTKDVSGMFGNSGILCESKIKQIDINAWNIDSAIDTKQLFKGCANLETIFCDHGTNWNTHAYPSDDMFKSCPKLKGEYTYQINDEKYDVTHAFQFIDGNKGVFTCIEKIEPYVAITQENADTLMTFYYDRNRKAFEVHDPKIPTYDVNLNIIDTTYQPFHDNCKNIVTKINIDYSFTDAPITSCTNLFRDFTLVTSIENINNLNTSNVTKMNYMFNYCSKLSTLDLQNFNTSNVTTMQHMFSYCKNMETVNVSCFDTTKVTDMSYLFTECNNLAKYKGEEELSINLSNFNTSNVITMRSLFSKCYAIKKLDLSNFDTSKVTTMQYMFNACWELIELDSIKNFNTNKVTDMSSMFFQCRKLGINKDESELSINLNNFDTTNVKDMNNMFAECNYVKHINLSSFDTNKVGTNTGKNPGSMVKMFHYCSMLEKLELSDKFNTSNVPDMNYMFNGCSKLSYLDLKSFNTGKVTNMTYMFCGCNNLENIDLGENFNLSNVTDTSYMFTNCSKLTSLDLKNFNTLNVTNMRSMFARCINITSLDLNSFNASKVTDLTNMFTDCVALVKIEFGSFYPENATKFDSMFTSCKNLKTINCSKDWSNIELAGRTSTNMFLNCFVLDGGNGTTYAQAKVTDISYAKPDGGTSNPGYFHNTLTNNKNLNSVFKTAKVNKKKKNEYKFTPQINFYNNNLYALVKKDAINCII